MSFFHLSGNAT